jgi:hypothetical protein
VGRSSDPANLTNEHGIKLRWRNDSPPRQSQRQERLSSLEYTFR